MDMDDLKKLKRGVPVVLHGSFGKVYPDGKVIIYANGHEVLMPRRVAESRLEKVVFFERRFRAGDEVKVTSRDGRFPEVFPKHPWFGKRATVVEDEDYSGFVHVRSDSGHEMRVAFFFLELVTPVEEILSYRVGDFATNGEICVWKDQRGKTEKVCSFNVNAHPRAKEAAEAECARLNKEWQTKVCRSEEGKEEA